MPMYVKLDIGQRGNIEAQVRYSKRGETDFDNASIIMKGRSVADVLAQLSKHYRGLSIDPPAKDQTK